MATDTNRDRVWNAVLELVEEKREASRYRRRFDASDVEQRVENPPSRRTVRDVLSTMVDYGRLEEGTFQGSYEPPTQET